MFLMLSYDGTISYGFGTRIRKSLEIVSWLKRKRLPNPEGLGNLKVMRA